MPDPTHNESVDECLSVMAIEHEWRADVVRDRIEALETALRRIIDHAARPVVIEIAEAALDA